MRLNPELQRYIWLEFSWHRLIVMPLIIGIIIFLAEQYGSPSSTVTSIAETIFVLLALIWGGHKAAQSVLEEVNDNTWDWQRLSSLSPLSLTMGKWLGSTSYCWYGASIALAAYIGSASRHMPVYYLACNVLLLVTGTLICHAAGIFVALSTVQFHGGTRKKIYSIGAFAIGTALGVAVISHQSSQAPSYVVTWYGYLYEPVIFAAIWAVVFLLWTLAGTYWKMRAQMRMRTGPWLWAAFVAFMMFFDSGFWFNSAVLLTSTAFSTSLLFLYIIVLTEPWDGVAYRKLEEKRRNGNYSALLDLMPRWVVSFVITLLAALWVFARYPDNAKLFVVTASFLCFAMRDIALLHYFRLHPQGRRATSATLFYFAVLYIVIPLILYAIKQHELVGLFQVRLLDVREQGKPLTLLSAASQAGIFIFLAFRRWKKYWQ